MPTVDEVMNSVDPKLARLVSPLVRQKLTDEEVKKGIKEVEKYVGENARLKTQLGRAATDYLGRKRMMTAIPNEMAREQIKEWAKLAPPPRMRRQARDKKPTEEQDPNIRPLLRPFIQKANTDEQTIAAAKKVEEFAAKNAKARGQIGDICRRIINADKLSNYGTKKCQEYMQKWAKDWKPAAKVE